MIYLYVDKKYMSSMMNGCLYYLFLQIIQKNHMKIMDLIFKMMCLIYLIIFQNDQNVNMIKKII